MLNFDQIELDLRTIESRAADVTPGQWFYREDPERKDYVVFAYDPSCGGQTIIAVCRYRKDAIAIVNYREDVLLLLDEIERIKAKLRRKNAES